MTQISGSTAYVLSVLDGDPLCVVKANSFEAVAKWVEAGDAPEGWELEEGELFVPKSALQPEPLQGPWAQRFAHKSGAFSVPIPDDEDGVSLYAYPQGLYEADS